MQNSLKKQHNFSKMWTVDFFNQTISAYVVLLQGCQNPCNLWVKQLLDFMNYPSLECLGRTHSISVKDVILDHSMAIVRGFYHQNGFKF